MSDPKFDNAPQTTDQVVPVSHAANTSCIDALRAVGAMASDQSTRDALEGLHALTRTARQAQAELARNCQEDGLTRQWVEALQLMDQLSATAHDLAGDRLVQTAVELQKSGKTA